LKLVRERKRITEKFPEKTGGEMKLENSKNTGGIGLVRSRKKTWSLDNTKEDPEKNESGGSQPQGKGSK